jgi:hypothetical protein
MVLSFAIGRLRASDWSLCAFGRYRSGISIESIPFSCTGGAGADDNEITNIATGNIENFVATAMFSSLQLLITTMRRN